MAFADQLRFSIMSVPRCREPNLRYACIMYAVKILFSFYTHRRLWSSWV